MGKITILDEQLSNMIAAGEVVERPASVVKELVENSIDAGSTRVEIHIEEGGLDLIRIVDDGHGMDRDDCRTSFERHATSKIKTTRDLFHIRSLGFRGEALPSIASVSRVELTSSEDSGKVGTRLVVEGGQVKAVEDTARVKGTDIIVRELFYNTPARLKYMKSIATEIGHISDYVNRLALTYPSISFTLTHNGKSLLQTSGDGKLLHVMGAIYGVQVAKLLLPISGETLDFKWTGFLSKTEVTRANRSYLTTLVNGRYIRNYALNGAIMRGYHTLLPIGRYPIVVMQIEMEPTLVDVNVHPAKLEVRFSKEDELCAAIEQSVQSTLRQGLKIVQPMQVPTAKRSSGQPFQPQLDLNMPAAVQNATARIREWVPSIEPNGDGNSLPKREQPVYFVNESPLDTYVAKQFSMPQANRQTEKLEERQQLNQDDERTENLAAQQTENRTAQQTENLAAQQTENLAEKQAASRIAAESSMRSSSDMESTGELELPETNVTTLAHLPSTGLAGEHQAVPIMFPVAQVHGTYIVAQNDSGMYLIDQHAAQERIFYEYFMQKLLEQSVSSQMMLFPHTVECTVAEAELLQKKIPLLQKFGLEIEAFGSRTFIVRAHPHWFPEGAEIEVIEELIQLVLEKGEKNAFDTREMREAAAIMMSCKASIKANRFLTMAEMEGLLNRLRDTTSPFTCPHGRPIVVHFSTYELQKMFKR